MPATVGRESGSGINSSAGRFCVLVLLILTSCERPDNQFTFIYSNEQPSGSIRSQSMVYFEEELEKRSEGRIQVELYSAVSWGTNAS